MPNVNIYHGAFRDEDVNWKVFSYTDRVSINDDEICERAFHMFNAPFEYLNEEDQAIFKMYRPLRSLSVGDVVEVNGVRYQCMPSWLGAGERCRTSRVPGGTNLKLSHFNGHRPKKSKEG
jgi:hypothetical protein